MMLEMPLLFCFCSITILFTKGLQHVQVHVDGSTTMSTHERKASIKEFYGTFIALDLENFSSDVGDF